MSIPHRGPLRFLDSVTPAAVFGLALASGCGRAPGINAPAPATPQMVALVDASKADEVLACAEEQYGAHGYFVQRAWKNSRGFRAQRETLTTGDAYEVNVAEARLAPVDGNPNAMRLWVWSETREHRARRHNEGYTLRPLPRGDVVRLAQDVLTTCGKK